MARMMENGDLHKTIQELMVEVAVLKTRVNTKEDALKIQAREYERRLHELNDAHNLARTVLATYLPREIFDKEHQSLVSRVDFLTNSHMNSTVYAADKEILANWRRQVDEDRAKNAGSKAMLAATASAVLSLASIATVVIREFLK